MFVVKRTVIGRVRFHKGNNENERIATMFFDKFACAFFQKLRTRKFERQVADSQLRESSALFVRRDARCDEKIGVITAVVSRNPFVKSSSRRPFFAEMPLAYVCSPIIFVLHQLREDAKPAIEWHAVPRASVNMRPRSGHERGA